MDYEHWADWGIVSVAVDDIETIGIHLWQCVRCGCLVPDDARGVHENAHAMATVGMGFA